MIVDTYMSPHPLPALPNVKAYIRSYQALATISQNNQVRERERERYRETAFQTSMSGQYLRNTVSMRDASPLCLCSCTWDVSSCQAIFPLGVIVVGVVIPGEKIGEARCFRGGVVTRVPMWIAVEWEGLKILGVGNSDSSCKVSWTTSASVMLVVRLHSAQWERRNHACQ